MKKNISLFIILSVLIGLNTGCTEKEPFEYNVTEPAINFWIEPTPQKPMPAYPDDLEESYDFGSFANFVDRGYAAFSNIHERTIGVQTQGYTITEDRKVFIVADLLKSGYMMNIKLGDDYVVRSGEGTAKFTYYMEAIPVDSTVTIVFTFDFNKTEFIPGVNNRRYYILKCSNSNGIPQNVNGFNLNAIFLMFWEMGSGPYQDAYGILSVTKLKFISLVLKSPNLSSLPTDAAKTALQERLKTSLNEYKELNATDPVKYPPLYNNNSDTWISFP